MSDKNVKEDGLSKIKDSAVASPEAEDSPEEEGSRKAKQRHKSWNRRSISKSKKLGQNHHH